MLDQVPHARALVPAGSHTLGVLLTVERSPAFVGIDTFAPAVYYIQCSSVRCNATATF